MNVVEIDAASNNGVENIREIREQVQYPPTEGAYRVYIIDEVHMLSTGAFNALLKTGVSAMISGVLPLTPLRHVCGNWLMQRKSGWRKKLCVM